MMDKNIAAITVLGLLLKQSIRFFLYIFVNCFSDSAFQFPKISIYKPFIKPKYN